MLQRQRGSSGLGGSWLLIPSVLLASTNAWAIPHAAASASPPLVVGGILVGVLLLSLSVVMLVRTFRTMRTAGQDRRIEQIRREADTRAEEWTTTREARTIASLIELLHDAETDPERKLVTDRLTEITGRYFGLDAVAWQAWWTADGEEFVRETTVVDKHEPPAGEFLPVS